LMCRLPPRCFFLGSSVYRVWLVFFRFSFFRGFGRGCWSFSLPFFSLPETTIFPFFGLANSDRAPPRDLCQGPCFCHRFHPPISPNCPPPGSQNSPSFLNGGVLGLQIRPPFLITRPWPPSPPTWGSVIPGQLLSPFSFLLHPNDYCCPSPHHGRATTHAISPFSSYVFFFLSLGVPGFGLWLIPPWRGFCCSLIAPHPSPI